MKDLLDTFNKELNYNKYFNQDIVCFLDIETTGFSRKKNFIYLIGIQYYSQSTKNWSIRQLFAENINEEKDILLEFIKLISNYKKIITYNGDRFDIPFINSRLLLLGIPYLINKDLSLDIYKVVKENNIFLSLNSLKLKSLEESLGLYREDLYSGKDCINFYYDYIKSHNDDSFNKIIQHNYEDLYYMIDILKIFDIIKEIKSFSFNYNEIIFSITINSIELSGEQLMVLGQLSDSLDNEIIHYDKDFNFSLKKTREFKFSIDCSLGLVSHTEKAYYIDKNNLVLPIDIPDNTKYNLSNRFLLLKVEKTFCIENIKNLTRAILNQTLKQY